MASLRHLRGLGRNRGHAHWFIHWGTPQQEKVIGVEEAESRARAYAEQHHCAVAVCDHTGYIRFIVIAGKTDPVYNTGSWEDRAWHNQDTN